MFAKPAGTGARFLAIFAFITVFALTRDVSAFAIELVVIDTVAANTRAADVDMIFEIFTFLSFD
jgi:hypothetical protein